MTMRTKVDMESVCPIALLRNLVRPDFEAAKLYWLARPLSLFPDAGSWKKWNTRFAGKEAFCTLSGNGYLHGALFDKKITAHRVVFALFHGRWPLESIDHIDGNRRNNKPENLREVSHAENMRNQPLSRASSTGHTGVSYDRSRDAYQAHITVSGKQVSLGRHADIDSAIAARAEAEALYKFHPNHGRKSCNS
jgi:hypothetical protein